MFFTASHLQDSLYLQASLEPTKKKRHFDIWLVLKSVEAFKGLWCKGERRYDTQHNDSQYDHTLRNDTQRYGLFETLRWTTLTVTVYSAECRYAECRYAECHSAKFLDIQPSKPCITCFKILKYVCWSVIHRIKISCVKYYI